MYAPLISNLGKQINAMLFREAIRAFVTECVKDKWKMELQELPIPHQRF